MHDWVYPRCLKNPVFRDFQEACGNELVRLGEKDPQVVVLGVGVASEAWTAMFAEKYPERFFNFDSAEVTMLGAAVGLAAAGKIPFAIINRDCVTDPYGIQIRQALAGIDGNVKIIATPARADADENLPARNENLSFVRNIPGIAMIVPADAVETTQVVEAAHRYRGPVCILPAQGPFPVVFSNGYRFQIGKGTVIAEGNDLAIFAVGTMVYLALKAAQILGEKGITARVVNLSTVIPVDEEAIIDSMKKTGAVLTVEDQLEVEGVGAAVRKLLSGFSSVPVEVAGADNPSHLGISPEDIVEAARRSLKRK